MERKLAAILAADVVGYSRLMAADEDGTLAALRAHRSEIFDPICARGGGRVFKLMGDGALVEFPSAVAAVDCAVDIQQTTQREDGQIRLRIGVNLGDVIVEGEDVYGNGVNVAARLEGLAEPGGIAISASVYESLTGSAAALFSDAGTHHVKNIERPIGVWQWSGVKAPAAPRMPVMPVEMKREMTITVEPFESLSRDEELGFFCEGVAEDIISAFATIGHLTVVEQGASTPARYVISGKVQGSGNRLRVSARLHDSTTGVQLWSERFDRTNDDLFAVQDDVTRRIVIAAHTALGSGSYTNRWQWGTEDFEAWQLNAKAFRVFQGWSPDSFRKAAALWEQALEIDPGYLAPCAAAAYCYAYLARIADGEAARDLLSRAEDMTERFVAQAPEDLRRFVAIEAIETTKGNHAAAISSAETALAQEPDDPACRAGLAVSLLLAGRSEEALGQISRAIEAVHDPAGWFLGTRVWCKFFLGRTDEALSEADALVAAKPDYHPAAVLAAAAAAELGQRDKATGHARRAQRTDPSFSVDRFVRFSGLRDPAHRERIAMALRSAGLPD